MMDVHSEGIALCFIFLMFKEDEVRRAQRFWYRWAAPELILCKDNANERNESLLSNCRM
jgi:hypothetical protein